MIGKVIYNILSTNAAVTALVPATNIYPYVLNEQTDVPAIVYTIDDLSPEYTKDGWALDSADFSVISLSNNYALLQTIVEAVRASLEMERGIKEGITIQHIHVTGMSEDYDVASDIFANRMSFNVNVINY